MKRVPTPIVEALVTLGVQDLAESRVQSLRERPGALLGGARFHLIGHLQTNKVKEAVARGVVAFHALDSPRLASALEAELSRIERRWPVYLEVNLAQEPQKTGCLPGELETLVEAARACPHLELQGLMGMAPLAADPERCRPLFRSLRALSQDLVQRRILPADAVGLSMGMSQDFEVAVEEGATVVRIGSALFEGLETA